MANKKAFSKNIYLHFAIWCSRVCRGSKLTFYTSGTGAPLAWYTQEACAECDGCVCMSILNTRGWDKKHSIIRFTWKDRHPKIKLANLQIKTELGGLSVPNFQLYFQVLPELIGLMAIL